MRVRSTCQGSNRTDDRAEMETEEDYCSRADCPTTAWEDKVDENHGIGRTKTRGCMQI